MASDEGRASGVDYPTGLSSAHAEGRGGHSVLRRLAPVLFLGLVVALSFSGIFGGTPNATHRAAAPRAELTVEAPRVLRSGEFFEMRFRIAATQPLADATLTVDKAFLHELTVNTMIPAAASEEAADGVLRFSYGPLAAGEAIDIKIDGQVNPRLFLGNEGAVAVADGEVELARVPLALTVLP